MRDRISRAHRWQPPISAQCPCALTATGTGATGGEARNATMIVPHTKSPRQPGGAVIRATKIIVLRDTALPADRRAAKKPWLPRFTQILDCSEMNQRLVLQQR